MGSEVYEARPVKNKTDLLRLGRMAEQEPLRPCFHHRQSPTRVDRLGELSEVPGAVVGQVMEGVDGQDGVDRLRQLRCVSLRVNDLDLLVALALRSSTEVLDHVGIRVDCVDPPL